MIVPKITCYPNHLNFNHCLNVYYLVTVSMRHGIFFVVHLLNSSLARINNILICNCYSISILDVHLLFKNKNYYKIRIFKFNSNIEPVTRELYLKLDDVLS